MHLADGRLVLSATDLANHLACRHVSHLDREVVHDRLTKPMWRDPGLELLRERGLNHEAAYVEHLRSEGRDVVELRDVPGEDALERTREAARRGAGVIVQAELADGRWNGRADLLVRVEEPSELGAWSYEVVDTKLAQETRGGTVLQLCLYADLLATIQGRPAGRMHVVKPGEGFPRETFRFADYQAYYRFVKARLEAFADAGDDPPYPEPVPHCDVCRWWKRCDDRRHDDDHLSLVAGLQTLHAGELRRQGVGTLAAFAGANDPLPEPPRRGHRETFDRLQAQAAIQLKGRREERPVTELLPPEPGKGLARLPEPTAGDVFLDFEGDPYVEDGGLEYLTGYAFADESGELRYEALWAEQRASEKRALVTFLDFLRDRLEQHPSLHVYHFAPYEPAALKRLASRHATRERELDVLLRGERFVDLHAVTRQSLRASVESYGLKPLEAFFGYEREVDLREAASPALRRVSCALEAGTPEAIGAEDRAAVEGYNRDDCLSLVVLRDWLEGFRVEAGVTERPPLKDGSASEGVEERSERVREVFDALTAGLPDDRESWDEEERARWFLAHLIEYFHREDKVAWWEYFARRDADDDELYRDRKALVGLELERELSRKYGVATHRYRFPPQEVSLDPGDEIRDLDLPSEDKGDQVGKVVELDLARGTVDIKKTKKTNDLHPRRIHVHSRVPPQPLDGSVLELARHVAEHGVDADGPELRAARDLLLRRPPRRRDPGVPLRMEGEEGFEAALRNARDLDGGVLAIQGPPGTGKTWSGARVILGLLDDGKRVGISATSHKVVRNLLKAVLKAAGEEGIELEVAHKPSSRAPRTEDPPPGMVELGSQADALAALDEGKVVGGVAWLWAAGELEGSLDYLFLDEAGQMSLAHVLACARAARNLVLLGDPQQLQQPQRGAHPEGTEISALNHLLGEHDTMPEGLGLFLEKTWRLHPSICSFTSELYYEGRLSSRPGCELQELAGPTPFAGSGLFRVAVSHEGNQSHAEEEVDAVVSIVDSLLREGVSWTDVDGRQHPLRAEDVLVIAPYNAQVAALSRRLPDVAVGTVDRFQGQEAPVVIYSKTSSSAADAPRGMGFLFDPHRLNVATSRARCACILVSTPALSEPECRTPDQMRWANGLARYGELASAIILSGSSRE